MIFALLILYLVSSPDYERALYDGSEHLALHADNQVFSYEVSPIELPAQRTENRHGWRFFRTTMTIDCYPILLKGGDNCQVYIHSFLFLLKVWIDRNISSVAGDCLSIGYKLKRRGPKNSATFVCIFISLTTVDAKESAHLLSNTEVNMEGCLLYGNRWKWVKWQRILFFCLWIEKHKDCLDYDGLKVRSNITGGFLFSPCSSLQAEVVSTQHWPLW